MSERVATTRARVPAAPPNELRALWALTLYPLLAMTRNVSTVAFGFLFPIVFIAVFGLIGQGGAPIKLGVTQATTSDPLFSSIQQVPGLDFTIALADDLDQRLRLGKIDGVLEVEGGRVILRVSSANAQANTSSLWIESAIDRINLE